MIRNEHERILPGDLDTVGALIDGLGAEDDRLWPSDVWPRVHFERPLAPGARGHHGPVHYVVDSYEPGRRVVLSFTRPVGLEGHHRFEVDPIGPERTRLRHVLEARPYGRARLTWPLFFRPLHDALLEDALDRAERATAGSVARPARWSSWVRILRRLAGWSRSIHARLGRGGTEMSGSRGP